ncbi:Ig-like domain-containing protein, partial [Serratia sp. M24T3]|uniref:Ig-like domain-containing protein n=1 Tax=Serratia sp. M24T3 TaxID=932213 RepID=UPI00025BC4B7
VSVSAKGEMTFAGAGNTNIAVSQAATATEDAPAEVTVAVTVKKAAGNALQVKALALKIDGIRPVEVTGGNARAFSYRSNDEKIASVDKEGLVTAHGKGSTTLTVIEAESANYWGQQAETSVTVDVKDAMPLKAAPVAVEFGAAKQQLNITGGNDGKLSYRSLDEKVVSVSAKGEMRFVGAGNTNIAVNQAATATEEAPAEVTVAVTVKKAAGNALQAKALALKIDGVKPVEVTGGNARAFSYRSSDEKI